LERYPSIEFICICFVDVGSMVTTYSEFPSTKHDLAIVISVRIRAIPTPEKPLLSINLVPVAAIEASEIPNKMAEVLSEA